MLFGKESENWREIWLQQMLACGLARSSEKKSPSLSMATERSLKWSKMRYLEVFFGNRSDGKPENHGLKSQ